MLVRLEHERAAGPEHGDGRPDERIGVPAIEERDLGLPLHDVGCERRELRLVHVRRVGDDEVPPLAGEAGEQIVVPELDLDPRALRVLARQRQGVLRDVDRRHAGSRMLRGDRQRDRARPRPDVEDTRRAVVVELLDAQGFVDVCVTQDLAGRDRVVEGRRAREPGTT